MRDRESRFKSQEIQVPGETGRVAVAGGSGVETAENQEARTKRRCNRLYFW